MSYEAELFASLVDQITAGAPAFSTPIDAARVFMALVPQTNRQWPAICIMFPSQPYSTGAWATTGNKRDEKFIAQVGIAFQVAPDSAHPYGDATTPGVLQLVTDVKNLLENGFNTFRAACGELVDYSISTSVFQSLDASPPLVTATMTIVFSVRVVAGARQ